MYLRALAMLCHRRQHSDRGPSELQRPQNHSMQSPYFQERKYRRFLMRYPVQVTFGAGDSVSELEAISSNISLGGMLLEAATSIPRHHYVSFTVAVPENDVVGAFQLTGEGQVVRVESHQSGKGFSIAVKCKRPISKLKSVLRDHTID